MPHVRTAYTDKPKGDVIAIVCSDIHLSHKPPLARSEESDWYAAMDRPLAELRDLQLKHSAVVLIAGDVFDKWQTPPELVNFALDALPSYCFVIPGQHDLPFHCYDDLHKSGLGVLIKARKVELLTDVTACHFRRLAITSFAWGKAIKPPQQVVQGRTHLALIHAYVGKEGKQHAGMDETKHVNAYAEQLAGYDIAVFGDNHLPFQAYSGDCFVFNCGGFMRRKSDDTFKPSCGLLYESGEIVRHYFDTSAEKLRTSTQELLPDGTDEEQIKAFAKSLSTMDCDPLDFEAQLLIAVEQLKGNELAQTILRDTVDAHCRR